MKTKKNKETLRKSMKHNKEQRKHNFVQKIARRLVVFFGLLSIEGICCECILFLIDLF